MAQDAIAILDFGSGKISVIIGERGVNDSIRIVGKAESDYAGFMDGTFIQPEQLAYAVGHAIDSAEASTDARIDKIYIGVPGDFSAVYCRDVSLNFPKKRKITDADLDALHDLGAGEFDHIAQDFTLINIEPVYYTVDDDRRLTHPPIGMKSSRLGGLVSYIFAENYFIDIVTDVIRRLGIAELDFVSSLLAEALYLFDDLKRDSYVLMIDVGHITTNVVLARGDGILFQRSFSMGGGNITADLAFGCETSFAIAESLKRKVILSINPGEDDVYTVNQREETISFPSKFVNEIVMHRIAKLAEGIEQCLASCEYDFPDYLTYSLTGGGLSYLRGGKDYLSKRLNKPIEQVVPKLPQFNRPHLASSLGLIDMVLNQQQPVKKKGLFARLFKKKNK